MAQFERYPDSGRLLLAERLIEEITHLAVGTGSVSGTPPASATGLTTEIGRARYLQREFVTPDPAGTIVIPGAGAFRVVDDPTNYLYFLFRFQASEAQGTWTEAGLFGGGVEFITRGAVLVDGVQTGDDRANTADVGLSGAYAGGAAQTITVTVTTGGGSGVAVVGYSGSSSGSFTPTFGTPTALGALGLALTFRGGVDGVLTLGDQWKIHATPDPASPTFASGGVYHPTGNLTGQVKTPGTLFHITHVIPGVAKGNVIRDVKKVLPILSLAA